MNFGYSTEATDYLKQKDKKLGEVIEKIGMIERAADTDLFASVVHHIVGQQISTKAQATIWQRINDGLGTLNADVILDAGIERLQAFGISFRKAAYITDFAEKVKTGAFDLEGIWDKSDEEAIGSLVSLKGIGVWTAEMILLFCMERQNVFSFDDLAISAACAWCTIIGRLTESVLSGTAGATVPTAVLRACTFGLWQAARFLR